MASAADSVIDTVLVWSEIHQTSCWWYSFQVKCQFDTRKTQIQNGSWAFESKLHRKCPEKKVSIKMIDEPVVNEQSLSRTILHETAV